ncbi:unnamed protein product [Effrenium voratum]|nr:unnamed protein product [Effrenium voratum]
MLQVPVRTDLVRIDQLAQEELSRAEGRTSPSPSSALAQSIRQAAEQLEVGLVERSAEVRLLLLAAFCGEHVLLLGPPGTAKSLLARRISRFLGPTATFFERLLTRFSVPEELFGPLSLKGLEEDEYVRKTAGYLPEASLAFVDEIFKANSAILNTLLSVVNERTFDNGPTKVPVPLRSLVAASNEAPESEELQALFDRLLFRVHVRPVSEEALAELVAATALSESDSDEEEAEGLALGVAEAEAARRCAGKVEVPSEVVEVLRDCRRFLSALETPEPVSDRRLGQAVRVLQVVAHCCGRQRVELCDCALLAYVFWSSVASEDLFRGFLFQRLARQKGRALGAILGGLLDRVETKVTGPELPQELAALRRAVEQEAAEAERQQSLAREHCWLPPKDVEALCRALDKALDAGNGPRTLLLEIVRLSVATELCADVGAYIRLRRSGGDLEWPQLGEVSESPMGDDEQTFKLGKHKGKLFSEVAREDVDYCSLVQRKVAESGFAGQTPLDKQVRAFVAYLKQRD